MLKIKLAYDINRFYKIFAEVLDRTPFHTKVRDFKSEGFLFDIQFDVREILEGYEDSIDGMTKWLRRLDRNITIVREAVEQ
jgi:hypothetical protein